MTRIWRSLPGTLRISAFGIALAAVGVVAIVWSNVIVPSHESDDEYTTWYLVGYLVLFAYFGASGFLAARAGSSIRDAALTGAVTAVVSIVIALVTFIVIDNLFLDVVMQQPDKAVGFAHSGLTSQRDYVNQGLLAGTVMVTVVLGTFGAAMGALGGLVRKRISGSRRSEPAAA